MGGSIKARNKLGGNMKKRGFTLIELLVVIAIIGILAVIIILNLASATEKSRYAKVKSELKTIDDGMTVAYTDGVVLPLTFGDEFVLLLKSGAYKYDEIVDTAGNQLLPDLPRPPQDVFQANNYSVKVKASNEHGAGLETRNNRYCVYSMGAFRDEVGVLGTDWNATMIACNPE